MQGSMDALMDLCEGELKKLVVGSSKAKNMTRS